MLNEPVLVDTGPLIAIYNARDPRHAQCASLIDFLPVGKAYTCWPVVVEAAYLLRNYPRDRNRLFDALAAEEFVLLALGRSDLEKIRLALEKYSDQAIDLADAALLHLANREGVGTVFTLDRRHFSVFRRESGQPLKLLPDFS